MTRPSPKIGAIRATTTERPDKNRRIPHLIELQSAVSLRYLQSAFWMTPQIRGIEMARRDDDEFEANPFAAPETDFSSTSDRRLEGRMEYATFWARFAANFVDGIIVFIMQFLIGVVVGVICHALESNSVAIPVAQILGAISAWLYAALQESSDAQATLGKKLIGIRVVSLDGAQISFGRATGRYFGKIISAVILMIGYLMQPFTEKRQALHDMMAGCLVIKA